MTTTVLNTKISEVEKKNSDVENKNPNHDKYITSPEFNKLTAENVAARLKQANLVNKTDFDNKLIGFNREVQKKKKSLTRTDHNFFLRTMYFTSNEGSQNTFVYQPTLDTLEF